MRGEGLGVMDLVVMKEKEGQKDEPIFKNLVKHR